MVPKYRVGNYLVFIKPPIPSTDVFKMIIYLMSTRKSESYLKILSQFLSLSLSLSLSTRYPTKEPISTHPLRSYGKIFVGIFKNKAHPMMFDPP
ncbi:hypothetical protein EYC84_003654 [Monilinia fructicola]|uniref:Uncharacterized protein n=1 Tax=Monilinia fructicola TaxID=38448 RepID=A0A5M9JYB1_MONFR|nr:hypothetical protein EYC84_003654 [Monilinia fructicola]